jgi:phage shock protein PspC (stress-responsive transcriptional regulator)
MKRTEQINLGGIIFHIDEDAFQSLQKYLHQVKIRFASESEGNEIINDIELRIAELLQLKISGQKQVITLDDVHEMIEIMGKPEDFSEESYDTDDVETGESRRGRRLYRDLDHNLAGGVCAGMGVHFNIDPVILRVLFIILSFPLAGFPVLIYLLLWIVTPAALTTAQKMEMRGGEFTIADIENSVKREFEHVKGNFKNYKNTEHYKQTREGLHTFGNALAEIVGFFGRIILIIIGAALIITGIGMIASMFGLFVFSDSFLFWTNTGNHHAFIPDFLVSMVNPKSLVLASIAFVIFVSAPILAIIYWGLKLILRFKANDTALSIVGAVAWILSILVLLGVTLVEVKEYAFSAKVEDTVEMHLPKDQTVYVKATQSPDNFSEAFFFEEGMEVYTHKDYPNRIYFEPDLQIRKSTGTDIYIKFEKEARGATNNLAREQAAKIEYNWNLRDSVLYIDPFFYQNNSSRWNFPELDIVLYLPQGQKVCIDESLRKTLNDVQTSHEIWTSQIPGKCWVMTHDGLDYE